MSRIAPIAALAILAGAAHAQVTFTPIAEFTVTDQSADGTWLVGAQGSNIVRWSADTGLETLYIDADYNGLIGVSDDGARVAGTIFDGEGTATPGVWTEGEGWVTTGPISGGGVTGQDGSAYALSGDGSTLAGLAWRSDWRARAFSWTESDGMQNLGSTFDNRSSRASAINRDGSVIGGFDEAEFGNRRPALWIDGVLTVLDPDGVGEVLSVNAGGTTVGGDAGWTLGADLWTFDGAEWNQTVIGYLPGTDPNDHSAGTLGVSADGSVAVGYNASGFGPFADYNGWIWTADSGMVDIQQLLIDNDIDLGDLDIRQLTDVSDDGAILTGWGYFGGFSILTFQITLGASCPADFNGDGEVNTIDVLDFLNAWTSGDSSADHNGDGAINTLDVLSFLNAWTIGC